MFYCGLYVVIPLCSNGEKKGCGGYVVMLPESEGLTIRPTRDGASVAGVHVN